jgi:hypothetical protein
MNKLPSKTMGVNSFTQINEFTKLTNEKNKSLSTRKDLVYEINNIGQSAPISKLSYQKKYSQQK